MPGLNLFTNNAATTLASGILSGATSLTVATGTGALFPTITGSEYFYCTLTNTGGTIEIVRITARTGDTMTIVRGQDGTTAAAWNTGDKFELRLNRIDLLNFPQLDSTNTFSLAQTLSVAPIISSLTGVLHGNGASAVTVASAAQIVSAIGSTAVTNATNATNVTGTVAVANGGTGASTAQAAMNTFAGATTSGSYLRGNGTNVIMSTIQAGDVPTLNQNTTGTAANVTGTVAIINGGTGQTTAAAAYNALNPMTTVGDIIYEGTGPAAARLPIGTTGQVLTVSGGIPAWSTPTSSGAPTVQTFDTGTAATWTKPSSANWITIQIWGGGGSGGNSTASGAGGGGGGGAYNEITVPFSNLVGTVTYTVGSGGAAQGTTTTNGNTGGTTSVSMASFAGGGTLTISAFGGAGGLNGGTGTGAGGGGGGIVSAGSSQTGGEPAGGTGTTANPSGAGGGWGSTTATNIGGGSFWGGAGGGAGDPGSTPGGTGGSCFGGGGGGGGASDTGTTGGTGGTSVLGGNGGNGGLNGGAPTAGTTPAGGGGGSEARASGAGGGGRVRFTYW